MGGLGPGIGGLEILVIGLLALIVVGPKDLPLLMRKVGQALGKARAMANEFRSSFDEMARQSELDELRKEVDALRRGQGIVPLGAEAEAAFKDISAELNQPVSVAPVPLAAPEEWPDTSAAASLPPEPGVHTAVPDEPSKPSRRTRAKPEAAPVPVDVAMTPIPPIEAGSSGKATISATPQRKAPTRGKAAKT